MLATSLRRYGADGAFQNLEQRLLYAFTGNIAVMETFSVRRVILSISSI